MTYRDPDYGSFLDGLEARVSKLESQERREAMRLALGRARRWLLGVVLCSGMVFGGWSWMRSCERGYDTQIAECRRACDEMAGGMRRFRGGYGTGSNYDACVCTDGHGSMTVFPQADFREMREERPARITRGASGGGR